MPAPTHQEENARPALATTRRNCPRRRAHIDRKRLHTNPARINNKNVHPPWHQTSTNRGKTRIGAASRVIPPTSAQTRTGVVQYPRQRLNRQNVVLAIASPTNIWIDNGQICLQIPIANLWINKTCVCLLWSPIGNAFRPRNC